MQLPGISTGIDTATMVQQLMAVSKQRLYAYKVQQSDYQGRNTALDELRGKLNSFNSALESLSDSESLMGFKATSTDKDILTASAATTGVFEGTHDVEVNQLANSERWVHSGLLLKESYVNAGTSGKFIYSYNHEEVVINTDAETTLEDLAGLINNDNSNPGVTATILKYDDGNEGVYHLMLSGNDAGSDYQISINSGTTQVLSATTKLEDDGAEASLSTKLVDLDQFTGILQGTEKIVIDDDGQVGSTDITPKELDLRDDMTVGHLIDRINDAYKGIAKAKFEDGKITLVDDVSGVSKTTMTLSVTGGFGGDPASIAFPTFSALAADGGTVGAEEGASIFASEFTRTQAAQDSQVRVDGYPANEVQTLSAMSGSPSGGKYNLTYDGETVIDIAFDATAQEIQAALETLTNVNAGDITVSGSLGDGDVKFTFATSIGDASLIEIDPGDTGATYSVEETASAWSNRSSNSLSDLMPGVSLELYDVGTVKVSLNKDTDSLKTKLKALVGSYNSTMSFIKEKTAYDKETNKAGVLISSYTTRIIKTIIRTGIRTPAAGFTEGEEEYIHAYDIGLDFSSKQDTLGTLELDETKLDEAIDNDYDAVAALIGAINVGKSSGTDADKISYKNSSSYTQAGDYEVEITTDGDNKIASVRVKLSTETGWRDQTDWNESGRIILEGRLDDDSEWYPERDLQIAIDLTQTVGGQTYTSIVHVQQGFAGALHDRLEDVLSTRLDDRGYLAIDTESGKAAIKQLDARIEREERRLETKEERLTAQFARLEKTMTLLQQQFSALSMLQQQA